MLDTKKLEREARLALALYFQGHFSFTRLSYLLLCDTLAENVALLTGCFYYPDRPDIDWEHSEPSMAAASPRASTHPSTATPAPTMQPQRAPTTRRLPASWWPGAPGTPRSSASTRIFTTHSPTTAPTRPSTSTPSSSPSPTSPTNHHVAGTAPEPIP